MIDIKPPVTPPIKIDIDAIYPTSAALKIIENLKRPLLLANEVEFAHKFKRKIKKPISIIIADTNKCFMREKLKESVIDIISDGRTVDTKVLASLVSMMKKGQICFPPPTPPGEKEITPFPHITSSRLQQNGGLQATKAAFYSFEKPYTTNMVLLPHKKGPECCPFFDCNPSYKINNLWYKPLNDSEKFGVGNDEMMKIAGMRRKVAGIGIKSTNRYKELGIVHHLVNKAYQKQSKFQKVKSSLTAKQDELTSFLHRFPFYPFIRRWAGQCILTRKLFNLSPSYDRDININGSSVINISDFLQHKLSIVEEVLRRLAQRG